MLKTIKAIYIITNKINGKQYVGQSVHPEKRWWEHKNRAKSNYDNYPIHLAISKYGEDNFIFKVIEWTENYNEKEKMMIQQLNTLSPNGYNLAIGGDGNIMLGEDHPRNTITNEDVENIIYDLMYSKMSDREIAKKYCTTDKIIADINHGYSHRRDMNYPIRRKVGLQKLSNNQVLEIINKLLSTSLSYQKIADEYNVSKGAIYHINKGLTFHDDSLTYPLRTRIRR